MPSDELLLKFFKHCVDKYPNVHPVRDWIFNKKNYVVVEQVNYITR